ncbi:hypothetical protein I6Y99_004393 [Vibrio parahaemolyticus]|nr:hypothetical protein [Vibrio parahaemolyticus]
MPDYNPNPSADKPWFCFCGDEFQFFATEEEAKEYAEAEIELCLDDEWDELVTQISVGKVTQVTQQVNKRLRPENVPLTANYVNTVSGERWLPNISYKCEYKPVPLERAD